MIDKQIITKTNLNQTAFNMIAIRRAFVNEKNKYGLINEKGKWVVEPILDEIYGDNDEFYFNPLFVRIGDKWGLLNRRGQWTVKPKYDSFVYSNYDEEGMLVAQFQGKWGFINRKGKWLIPPVFESTGEFFDCEDLCAAKYNGLWGFINRKGEFIIFPQYESLIAGNGVYIFDNYSMVAVKYMGKWGWIDSEDRWIIEPVFDEVRGYFKEDGLCPATFKGEKGTVNREGKWREDLS